MTVTACGDVVIFQFDIEKSGAAPFYTSQGSDCGVDLYQADPSWGYFTSRVVWGDAWRGDWRDSSGKSSDIHCVCILVGSYDYVSTIKIMNLVKR